MRTKIKKILGLNNYEFDDLIDSYINAAKKDLELVGIKKEKITDEDPIIFSAIVCYVKSQYDPENSQLYMDSYNLQKDSLRRYREYIE